MILNQINGKNKSAKRVWNGLTEANRLPLSNLKHKNSQDVSFYARTRTCIKAESKEFCAPHKTWIKKETGCSLFKHVNTFFHIKQVLQEKCEKK
ncbi:hypothetical protein V1L52_08930 [Treponema sp. HNW]|uniref:hypothetical protein n=1 Tax=Treponema sp. HNW TaxID=3116654 RepID=UPI003D0F4DCA